VTDRADVDVRLLAFELAFCHFSFSVSKSVSGVVFKVSVARLFHAPPAEREPTMKTGQKRRVRPASPPCCAAIFRVR
jgi:hypothetical protein